MIAVSLHCFDERSRNNHAVGKTYMAMLNEKPVRLLMQDMLVSMGLGPGQSFTRE
jgi:hypothetical protein